MVILVELLGRPLLRPYPNSVVRLNLKILAVSVVHIQIFQMDGHQHQRQEHQLEHRRKHHQSEPHRRRRRHPQEHVIESENEKIYWKYLNQIN